MAATVDNLFAFDATTHLIDDHHYQGLADAYVLDPATRDFMREHNPRPCVTLPSACLRPSNVACGKRLVTTAKRLRSNCSTARNRLDMSEPVQFPLAAVVGAEDLKLALCLTAIDPKIGGVLIEGPRGMAKSTLARGLADLLGEGRS